MQINLPSFQLASWHPCPTGVKFNYVIIILLLCAFYGFYSVLWQTHPFICYYFFPGFYVITHNLFSTFVLKILIEIMSQRDSDQRHTLVFYFFLLFPIISYYFLLFAYTYYAHSEYGNLNDLQKTRQCE